MRLIALVGLADSVLLGTARAVSLLLRIGWRFLAQPQAALRGRHSKVLAPLGVHIGCHGCILARVRPRLRRLL